MPMKDDNSLLIVAGEASGDRIAAGIARAARGRGVACFGMGGAASRAAGVELVADIERSAAMGLTEVARRFPAVLGAFARLRRAVRERRPRAAVLVDYVEFNLRLGRYLRRRGVRVLFCVAPQVWAWRPGRLGSAKLALDRMATILPFEPALWRKAGVDAHYVGHPALDAALPDRGHARQRLGLDAEQCAVALLPGSRPHEVRRHAAALLAAVREVARRGRALQARVLAAPWLDPGTRAWLDAAAREAGVPVAEVDPIEGAQEHLPAFDAALVASGTASLECALAGALPVVVYRVSPLTAAVARRLLKTPHIALPNVVLGERAFPELLQNDVASLPIACALEQMLERRGERDAWAQRLRTCMAFRREESPLPGPTTGDRAFALVEKWLAES
jgi:lipid-A-disaccharide synthase